MRQRKTSGFVVASTVLLASCETVPEEAKTAAAYECPVGSEGCDAVQPVGPGGEFTVVSSREGEFSFTVEDGIAVTGEIEVRFTNEGEALHNVEALGAADGSIIPEAPGGGEDTGVFLLLPGEWTIICNVPGHREAGMEATVQVFATEEEAEDAFAAGDDPNDVGTDASDR